MPAADSGRAGLPHSRTDRLREVATFIKIGLWLATIYSALAIGVYALMDSRLSRSGLRELAAVIASYFVAAVSAGALLGWLRPWLRGAVGRVVMAVLASMIAMICFGTVNAGPLWGWEAADWATVLLSGGTLGILIGIAWR